MKIILGILLLLNTSIVLANNWNCRNHNIEISCDKGKCEVSKDFTPLDVNIDQKGNISIGMYTGVWEGKGKIIKEQNYMIAMGHNLVFSTAMDMKEDFIIVLDTDDKVAFLKGYGYAMPMTCKLKNK